MELSVEDAVNEPEESFENASNHTHDLRCADKFVFEIEIPETFLAYNLPKITIQPFVENSLLHAINNYNIVNIKLLCLSLALCFF